MRRRLPSGTRASRQRGLTLLEVMLSMAVVLVGMLGLFRVLSVASRGTSSAQRFSQAQARAQQVLETINNMPRGVLDCLVVNVATSWNVCEIQCQTALGGGMNAAQSCVFINLAALNQGVDSTQQAYTIVYDTANAGDRSSWVRNVPASTRLYQAQVTVGWRDDGTAPGGGPWDHRVTLRTNIFRN